MSRKLCDINGIHAVICKRNRNIGFTAAEGCLKLIILEETVISVGSKAKHYFAEGYNLSHFL